MAHMMGSLLRPLLKGYAKHLRSMSNTRSTAGMYEDQASLLAEANQHSVACSFIRYTQIRCVAGGIL